MANKITPEAYEQIIEVREYLGNNGKIEYKNLRGKYADWIIAEAMMQFAALIAEDESEVAAKEYEQLAIKLAPEQF